MDRKQICRNIFPMLFIKKKSSSIRIKIWFNYSQVTTKRQTIIKLGSSHFNNLWDLAVHTNAWALSVSSILTTFNRVLVLFVFRTIYSQHCHVKSYRLHRDWDRDRDRYKERERQITLFACTLYFKCIFCICIILFLFM